MTTGKNFDSTRRAALDRIDRTERAYRAFFLAAVAVEALFLAGFLLLADLGDRLHLLLLIATVATYTIVALGLLALGQHVTRCTHRVLKALDGKEP
jgi:hypothetical protein